MTWHTEAIEGNPAAWCAIELALIDLLARSTGQTVESWLSLPALEGPFRYTAVLGDAGEAAFTAIAQGYRRMGFTDFKVKLSGDIERDRAKMAVLDSFQSPAIRVRVSKMGGLLRSLGVVSAARARGIPIIVGAQVGETSVLTRAALTVAQAAAPDLLAQERAFGTFLLEHDVCEPSLMFGAGGMLDPRTYPLLDTPGFGLQVAR